MNIKIKTFALLHLKLQAFGNLLLILLLFLGQDGKKRCTVCKMLLSDQAPHHSHYFKYQRACTGAIKDKPKLAELMYKAKLKLSCGLTLCGLVTPTDTQQTEKMFLFFGSFETARTPHPSAAKKWDHY